MIRTYYLLTKPGIIMGNLLATIAGFALASHGDIDPWLFIATLFGLGLIIASACVFNNYSDRHLDTKMQRTKNRPLALGLIQGRYAISFATILGIVGVSILQMYTNILTVFIALCGFFIYVVLYAFWKRRSVYGTLVGSISGATPPIVGYCAVSNKLDGAALLLFLSLMFWQMPHFFAIAIYRIKDYKAAAIPVLPIRKGMLNTKINMILYAIAFGLSAVSLTILGYTSYTYLVVLGTISAYWIYVCLQGLHAHDDVAWARKVFGVSLIVMTLLCGIISIDSFLP